MTNKIEMDSVTLIRETLVGASFGVKRGAYTGINSHEISNEILLNHRWIIRSRVLRKKHGVELLKHCTAFHDGLITVYAFPRDNGKRTLGFNIMKIDGSNSTPNKSIKNLVAL